MIKSHNRFLPVKEILYRKRRGILILRDDFVGHIPKYLWSRIGGKRNYRSLPKI